MQVQKYKLGKAIFERNFGTGAYYCKTTDDWLSKDGLKLAGATPLIESEAGQLKEIKPISRNFKPQPKTGDWKQAEQEMWGKINELVDAVNALQKKVNKD